MTGVSCSTTLTSLYVIFCHLTRTKQLLLRVRIKAPPCSLQGSSACFRTPDRLRKAVTCRETATCTQVKSLTAAITRIQSMGTLSLDSTVSFLLDAKGALKSEDVPTLTAEGTESSNKSDITRCGARALERVMLRLRLKETLPLALHDRLRFAGDDCPGAVAECLQLESFERAALASPQVKHHLPDVVDPKLLLRLT